MRGPIQIRLRGHERRDQDTLLLLFAVDDGNGDQAASVLVSTRAGTVRFPHELCDTGLPLGPVADAALLERAHQTVAVLDAAETWSIMRRDRSRTRRRPA